MANKTLERYQRRKNRVSPNIQGTALRPRVCVFRSNKFIYAQAIDDLSAKTIVSASSAELKEKSKGVKTVQASQVGKNLAEALKKKNITTALFDRSRFAYAGRVKALAEGLREGGIKV